MVYVALQVLLCPFLDERITQTYAASSKAVLSKGLYDSYIRAIRWASDRISAQGVIGFVTNAGFIDTNTADGLRKCLVDEFSSLYIFHLRGNQRTSGERSRQEGGKIFGSGSRAPIAISILVKNPNAEQQGQIYFHDIGDYLSREEKLSRISQFKSINGVSLANGWVSITPDEHGDWLRQRDNSFNQFIVLGDKKKSDEIKLFNNFSLGVATNRDAWAYNSSKSKLSNNMSKMINVYNFELDRFNEANPELDAKSRQEIVNDFIDNDPKRISWTVNLKRELAKNKKHHFDPMSLTHSLYRPFTKQWLYFNRVFNERLLQMPRIFPNMKEKNLAIMIKQRPADNSQLALMLNYLPELQTDGGAQSFPLYLYEEVIQEKNVGSGDLFDESLDLTVTETKYERKDGISDEGLQHFQTAFPSEQITKEDIFYYTYGLLHSEEYRERYADNLTKELPRIPCVKKAEDFWAFAKAGRDLAHWHLNYETVEPYKATLDTGSTAYNQLTDAAFYVEKMKFAKKGEKGTVVYNKRITIKDIPVEAYDYVVNGKPALEWVMERQGVSTHKDSGIVNDANDWAIETMNNAAYPLELFLRVITVSLETMKIVKALPKLDI